MLAWPINTHSESSRLLGQAASAVDPVVCCSSAEKTEKGRKGTLVTQQLVHVFALAANDTVLRANS